MAVAVAVAVVVIFLLAFDYHSSFAHFGLVGGGLGRPGIFSSSLMYLSGGGGGGGGGGGRLGFVIY